MIFTRTILALTVAISAPSFAGEKEVAVSYQDLNLTSTDGRDTLDRRIQDAAADVCTVDNVMPLQKARIERRCRAATIADARHNAKVVVARAQGETQLAAR